MRKKQPELVHGLKRKVELSDWDCATLLAALKYYAKNHARHRAYCRQLSAKIRRQFGPLIADTKRLHSSLAQASGNTTVDSFVDNTPTE